jgi:hypothetical protein
MIVIHLLELTQESYDVNIPSIYTFDKRKEIKEFFFLVLRKFYNHEPSNLVTITYTRSRKFPRSGRAFSRVYHKH